MRKLFFTFSALLFFCVFVSAQEKLDMDMLNKIRKEGLENSHVMDIAFHLTDVSGPRLTSSPGFFRAANWAKDEMTRWGLSNAQLEAWGEFGKGWELQKSYVAMTIPYYKPLIAFPKSWTKGTNGLKNGEIILVNLKDSTDLEKYRGKLAGKIILLDRTDTLKQSFTPDAHRFTDEELDKMAKAQPQQPRQFQNTDTAQIRRFRASQGATQLANRLKEMALKENALAAFSYQPRGKDGTIGVQGGGAYSGTSPENLLDIVIAMEDYQTLIRLVKAGIPIKLEMDVKTAFTNPDLKAYNVVAEIKGTDSKLKDEIVMLGGHLDSWHSATGATDNAAGCSVMMEVVRIIKALNIRPRRTIRIALWSGEEEGLLGSRAYVKSHFADTANGKWILKPEYDKFSSYFNIDNGTGKVRGIYLQGNDKVRDIFTQWLQPFSDLGAATVTISNTGGTDHQSFDRVGLPGFQFIQDPIEYDTRTHHTNMDTYDHLIADDLKQIATIVASFVYDAAMRDEKLPRKEMPQPPAATQRGF
ncbi:MAG TPA: M20/M25/M40 family metallo-hydrolase [Chitinophagaceae bacterium]|nr:M20/M25/M40 family metallo-hydrolase [Chitinophagaceae bacterium]